MKRIPQPFFARLCSSSVDSRLFLHRFRVLVEWLVCCCVILGVVAQAWQGEGACLEEELAVKREVPKITGTEGGLNFDLVLPTKVISASHRALVFEDALEGAAAPIVPMLLLPGYGGTDSSPPITV